jgi:heptaprenylglyceryl phosphate synthase
MSETYFVHIYLWSEDEGGTPLEVGLSADEVETTMNSLRAGADFIEVGNTFYSSVEIKKVTIL